MARAKGCKIVGSFSKKKLSRKWTWVSPDKSTRNEIDHMQIDDISLVKKQEVLSRFGYDSDHQICRGEIWIEKRVKSKRGGKESDGNLIIPQHRKKEAKEWLEEKLKEEYSIQEA